MATPTSAQKKPPNVGGFFCALVGVAARKKEKDFYEASGSSMRTNYLGMKQIAKRVWGMFTTEKTL